MASAYEHVRARQAAVARMGRSLTRRARSQCELCSDAGSLRVVEIPPLEEDPEPDRAILACERCRGLLSDGVARVQDNALRFLEQSVWSEVLPAQLAAIRITQQLADEGIRWARDTIDGLWLPEEVETLL